MSVYLDASVLFSLVLGDAHSASLIPWMSDSPPVVASAWTVTEVSSAFSHHVRTRMLTPIQRDAAEARLDRWVTHQDEVIGLMPDDFPSARRLVRQHSLLRAADALHLAVACRLRLDLATFDLKLADAARSENVKVVTFGGGT